MILLFGPTGAGKSMQGQMLAVRQGWKWLSTGEMLRQSTDPAVIATLKAGELVSDKLTYQVFDHAVQEAYRKHYQNIIVDGFPRTKEQAAWLDDHLARTGDSTGSARARNHASLSQTRPDGGYTRDDCAPHGYLPPKDVPSAWHLC